MELRDYQKEAVEQLLAKKKAILANPTGSGKTLIALEVIKQLNLPTLVVVQKNKIIDWIDEGEAHGVDHFAVTNYANVHSFAPLKGKIKVLVVDECQNMGSYGTRKGRATIEIAKLADYVLFLSATPLRSSPKDVYWPLRICKQWDGTIEGFRLKFCGAYIHKGFLIDSRGITNKAELLDRIALASVKTAGNIRKVFLNEQTITIDNDSSRFVKSGGTKRYIVPAFEEVSTEYSAVGDIKLDFFKEWLKTNELAEKAVFFTHHRKVTTEIAELLDCNAIIGGLSIHKKQQYIKDFINKDKGYLVVSMRSGSEGLNIPNCKTCYFIELAFSPLTYRQAYSRLVRDMKDTKLNVFYIKYKNEHTDILNELKQSYLSF